MVREVSLSIHHPNRLQLPRISKFWVLFSLWSLQPSFNNCHLLSPPRYQAPNLPIPLTHPLSLSDTTGYSYTYS